MLTEILPKYYKELILEINIFCILLNHELQHSGSLWSTHERPWALLGINEYCTKALWVLNSPWCHDHECLSSLMRAVEAMTRYSWLLKAAYECSWVLMSAQKCPWVLIIAHECSWHHVHVCSGLLMSIHEYSWALVCSHGINCTHKH